MIHRLSVVFYLQKIERIDCQKSQQPKQILYRNVFPSKLQIERFRQLQQARINTIEDQHLGKDVQYSIMTMHEALIRLHQKDSKLEKKKEAFFGKFKTDYVEGQLNENLKDFQNLLLRHQQLNQSIKKQRSVIERSLKITEIKKALKLQNQLLKSENERLKTEEKRIDYLYSTKK